MESTDITDTQLVAVPETYARRDDAAHVVEDPDASEGALKDCIEAVLPDAEKVVKFVFSSKDADGQVHQHTAGFSVSREVYERIVNPPHKFAVSVQHKMRWPP